MKINTQRFIDVVFGRLICRILDILNFILNVWVNMRGYFINGVAKKTTITPKNICIILLSEMGSLTLTFPMVERLKFKYPDGNIFILTFEKNIEIIKLLSIVPEKNILTVGDSSFFSLIYDSLTKLWLLRKNKIDTTIDCELFSRISSIYSFLSGAKIRVGFHPHTQEGLFRGNHINRRVLYNPHLHISHQFVNLVEAIDSKYTPLNKRLVLSGCETHSSDNLVSNYLKLPKYNFAKYSVGEKDKKMLLNRMNVMYPNLLKRKLIIINPSGGVLPIRAWYLDYYCKVAISLVKAGYSVAITGLKEDKNIALQIINSFQNCSINGLNKDISKNELDEGLPIIDIQRDDFNQLCVDMTGFTKSIKEFLTLLSISNFLITNDGGPGHFAALTSTKAIVLFGPETPVLYGCLNPNGINLYANYSCSPCLTAYNHRNSPCDGDNLCLKSILPEHVLENFFQLMESD